MTLNPTDLSFIHQYQLGGEHPWHLMKVTHKPTGVSVQVEGQHGYFEIRRLAEEELERELAKRRT